MPKTITLRIDEDVYRLFKIAASAEKRTISNFIEYATLNYLTEESYVSDAEMKDILADHKLLQSLKSAKKEIKKGKYKIVA
ncbi:MAG: hypothetical protein PHP56_07325 [Smithellaceae bacterium]|jgi:uncharacterized protein (DUF1778 family)|nr:hypothetical protein [Smithellaceae bacterium]MDD3259004.1 hypothetical protein [Smithellaceae bacterium]HOZ62683.1 hypothetical protein [Smithellaceae bacterium]